MKAGFACKYHSNRDAIEKCENCGAYICLECKKLYHTRHSTSTGLDDDGFSSSSSYSTSHVFCPLCYYDTLEKSSSGASRLFLICPIIFIVIFVGFAIFMVSFLTDFITEWNSIDMPGGGPGPEIMFAFIPFFFIIPFGILGCMLRQFFVVGPRTASNARKEREIFLQSLEGSSSFEIDANSGIRSNYCKTCGQKLDWDERYCSNCGTEGSK